MKNKMRYLIFLLLLISNFPRVICQAEEKKKREESFQKVMVNPKLNKQDNSDNSYANANILRHPGLGPLILQYAGLYNRKLTFPPCAPGLCYPPIYCIAFNEENSRIFVRFYGRPPIINEAGRELQEMAVVPDIEVNLDTNEITNAQRAQTARFSTKDVQPTIYTTSSKALVSKVLNGKLGKGGCKRWFNNSDDYPVNFADIPNQPEIEIDFDQEKFFNGVYKNAGKQPNPEEPLKELRRWCTPADGGGPDAS